jgi:hypothetical protein
MTITCCPSVQQWSYNSWTRTIRTRVVQPYDYFY